MALATWWHTDPKPTPSLVPGMQVRTSADAGFLAAVTGNSKDEVQRRLAGGHRPYVALIDGIPASYGWVATRSADIGEIGVAFELEATERYLWDFKTHPDFRGRGIYPRLLSGIVEQEMRTAERFWILAAPENGASNTGIGKANFRTVGTIGFRADGSAALVPDEDLVRAAAGGKLLGLPVTSDATRPCWACELSRGCGCNAGDGACTCHASNVKAHRQLTAV